MGVSLFVCSSVCLFVCLFGGGGGGVFVAASGGGSGDGFVFVVFNINHLGDLRLGVHLADPGSNPAQRLGHIHVQS